MFPKTFFSFHRQVWLLSTLALLFFLLSACSTSRPPLQITEMTINPDPLIGQVVTLHIEFMSPHDEPDTTLEIFLPEGIKLIKGDLIWKGALTASQSQTHEISICTLYEGNWWILTHARSWYPDQTMRYSGEALLVLDITLDGARVTLGDEYVPTSAPDEQGPAVFPTPFPESRVSPCP
jgi:hypothetical protein